MSPTSLFYYFLPSLVPSDKARLMQPISLLTSHHATPTIKSQMPNNCSTLYAEHMSVRLTCSGVQDSFVYRVSLFCKSMAAYGSSKFVFRQRNLDSTSLVGAEFWHINPSAPQVITTCLRPLLILALRVNPPGVLPTGQCSL